MMDGRAWHLLSNFPARLEAGQEDFRARQKKHREWFGLEKKRADMVATGKRRRQLRGANGS
jgi:hypothetical protein